MRSESSAFFGTAFRPFLATARANISGVHPGAFASRTTSASIALRTLESLVNDFREVETRFMFRGLANRNDTTVLTALGACNRDDLISQEPEGQERSLYVCFAHVLSGQGKPLKMRFASMKSMPCSRRLARRFASSHRNMGYCSYGM